MLSPSSTWMGDRLGTLGAVAFWFSIVLILDMLQYQDLSTGRTTRLYIFFMNYGRITRTGRFRGKAPFASTVRREFDPRWQRLCIFWYR